MNEAKKGIGDRYQEETKYSREAMKTYSAEVFERAGQYKHYRDAKKKLPLPHIKPAPGADFWDTLISRRSERNFSTQALSLDELALLILAIQGITDEPDQNMLRAAPSAGALCNKAPANFTEHLRFSLN